MKCVYACECGKHIVIEHKEEGFPKIAIECPFCSKWAGLSTKVSNYINRKETEQRKQVLKSIQRKK
jgi:hypothetical protein